MIELLHQDCMDYMRGLPDKAFDLAIVDPPYGIDHAKKAGKMAGTQYGKAAAPKAMYTAKDWDAAIPGGVYFRELFRVSANQIVWGGNYMTEHLPPRMGWVFWDKHMETQAFSDGELAWTSFERALAKFDFMWNGMIQGNMRNKEQRIHPTQKPVALYRWLLQNYAEPGQRILDTHLGSGSSAIAADIEGFDFVGMDIDLDYITAARKRLAEHQAQPRLFEPERPQAEQLSMDPAA